MASLGDRQRTIWKWIAVVIADLGLAIGVVWGNPFGNEDSGRDPAETFTEEDAMRRADQLIRITSKSGPLSDHDCEVLHRFYFRHRYERLCEGEVAANAIHH